MLLVRAKYKPIFDRLTYYQF